MSSARYSLRILIKSEFSRHTFEKHSNTNFMKILPVGAELFLSDAQQTEEETDMTKLTLLYATLRKYLKSYKGEALFSMS